MNALSPLPGLAVIILMIGEAWLALRLLPRLAALMPVPSTQASGRFYPQLEGLRGLLAVGVFVHHSVIWFFVLPSTGKWGAPPSNFYSQLGDVPVLIFFFLTGFLFWSKVSRKGLPDVRRYFIARVRRLTPAYLFAMTWFFLLIAVSSGFRLHTSLSTLLLSASSWIFFGIGGMHDVNGLTRSWYLIARTPWTLGYEWKFYVLLPFLVWFARKSYRTVYLLALFAVLFLVCRAGSMHQGVTGDVMTAIRPTAAYLLFSFGVGIAVAAIHHRWRRDIPLARSWWVALIGVLCTGVIFFGRTAHSPDPVCSLIMGAVFLSIVYGNTFRGLLVCRPVLLLGKCSYSLYLLHGLVLSTVFMALRNRVSFAELPALTMWSLTAATSLLVVSVSLFSYIFVEAPCFREEGVV